MVAILLSLLFVAPAQQPTIPVDGQPFDARLVSIENDWTVRFESGSERRSLAAVDLVSWGALRERARASRSIILLADGGRLAARVSAIRADRLIVDSPLWGEVSLPVEVVRGVVFSPPAGNLQRDRLQRRVAAATGQQDRLLLENGDSLSGLLVAAGAGPPRGGENELAKITLDTDAGRVAVEVSRVAALIFNPALAAAPRSGTAMRALLGFDDGSALYATEIANDGALVTISLAGGIRITTDSASMWEEVVALRPLSPRVAYLSDVEPLGYKHVPFLEMPWPYKNDRNVLGGRLRAGDKMYAKGIGMHSRAGLSYRLGGSYQRFEAELAIDAQAGKRGSVTFRVVVDDGKGNRKTAYASSVVRGGEPPIPVSVDISGAAGIVLIVDFADHGDQLDYANWLNARLIRRAN